MDFGSAGHTKAAYAATLAATMAWFLHQQGDATGLMTFDAEVRDFLPARHRPGHLRRLMLALEHPPGGKATDLISPLRRASEILRKRGVIVLVSDFLAPTDRLETSLTLLAAAGHEVSLFQVLDPLELSLDLGQPAWVEDVESGRRLFIDPAVVRQKYQHRMEEHGAALRTICQRLGMAWHRVVSDQPLEPALMEFLRDRSRRRPARRPGRHGARP